MRHTRVVPFAVAVAALLVVAGIGAPSAHAGGVTDPWASPTGLHSASCAQADPCDIVTAINDANLNSTVTVLPGVYGTAAAPVADLYNAHPIAIRAAQPAQPPVIFATATGSAALSVYGSTVSDLQLVTSGSLSLSDHSVGNRLAIYDSGGTACAVDNSILLDSVCSESAAFGNAVGESFGGTGTTTATLDSVTAVSTGDHGVGILLTASGGLAATINATNTIVHGKQHDVSVNAFSPSTVAVNLDHSAYRPATDVIGINSAVTGDASDVHAPANFVDLAAHDYNEKKISPTIDAGRAEPATAVDLARHPRTLGRAPDMGALEFFPAPTVSHLQLLGRHHHRPAFSVRVNPEGLGTTVALVARHNNHVVRGKPLGAGHGRTARQLRFTITLDPTTTYRVRAVATSKGGTVQSKLVHVTTT